MKVKVKIVIDGNSVAVSAGTYEEVRHVLEPWYAAVKIGQDTIDTITARVAAANDKLQAAVDQNKPSS